MNILRAVLLLACGALVGACGEKVSPMEKMCEDEITRKVASASRDETTDSIEISGITKDGDGNNIVSGTVEINEGAVKKSLPFSCVMQGDGESASVIRADLIYN